MTQEASSANPHPEPPYILALDIGTSSTRALLFDAAGNTLPNVLAQRPYQLRITNEGEVSVDPDALVAVVSQTIYDSLELAGPLAQHIGAVAIDTFWHSLMGVDADNRPLTPLVQTVIAFHNTRSRWRTLNANKMVPIVTISTSNPPKVVHLPMGCAFCPTMPISRMCTTWGWYSGRDFRARKGATVR